ncbi:glycosyltransferase 61 family protein [Rhodovulum imhoffii]|uniref:glycosyltransferase 61 family protein n=1 Tax=Rhodovulum imhoffii TaxID=365340 RepID=UPI001913CFC4|nr:glycosyltransferase 61 family protein [Rhodovulum imhoffii]
MAEPCLFAGVLNNMFGHNLTTGLGRVWALDHLPKETGLLYVVRMGSPRLLAQLQIRMGKILGCFGVERPVRVVASSVSAPVLYTALDKYGENYLGGASYEFVSWVHGRLRPYITADVESGNRLYVTRANVSRLQGRFACEDRLSENLARSGYKRFAPEEHSLQEQLEAYSRAEKLIFAEGSALHFFAFVKKPVQQVAVIQRREALPPLISRQIHAFDPQPVQFVNSIERVVFPKTLETNRAISILDFQRCKEILRATGFVDDRAEWEFPKAREIEGSVAEGRPGEEFLDEQGWNEWRETVRKEKISRRMARQAGSGA